MSAHAFPPAPYLERPNARGPLARAAWTLLRLARWRVVLTTPIPSHCVFVFAPHTSNWDFAIGLLAKWVVGVRIHWVGKDSLFRGPLGRLLARWGGIPVNRREHTGFIERMREAFARDPDFKVAIAPEGTRRRTEHWKSGFYHLARAAGVPVGLAFIDYPRREIGIGAFVALTGDVDGDMRRIAAFYEGKRGRRASNEGPVRLREGR